ncbi:hypothetical protein KY285_015802 [Solanum tuberosum]|nr:hypothetical protein KY285_015802 [Solanum tuberosum]
MVEQPYDRGALELKVVEPSGENRLLASAAFFVTGYIQDKKCMGKTVTHAGTGCVEALDADHYLQELDDNEGFLIQWRS